MDSAPDQAQEILRRYRRAKQTRGPWESIWQDCYDFALPQRSALAPAVAPDRRADRLFDGTAPDASDQLAASLMSQLVPPWTRWVSRPTMRATTAQA